MEDEADNKSPPPSWQRRKKRKGKAAAYIINTELGALLAVIRRPPDPTIPIFALEENNDTNLIQSLKSLRAYIFNPHQEWETIDPSIYVSPFLDVIQSDEVPARATAIALSAVTNILKLELFDEKTPGAKDAINSMVMGITGCRLERTEPLFEESVMMRILQALTATMKHRASFLLTDHAACTLVNTCFQVVQQSGSFSDMLRRGARLLMTEIIMIIYSRMSEISVQPEAEYDVEDELELGYGINTAVEIFQFLCSLLHAVQVVETEGSMSQTSDEDVQHFALSLMNSAIELGGDAIRKHLKFLGMIQDDLFHYLVHYGMTSSPLVLSMICSAVLNVYHFLRSFIRLQLEAFFEFVLLRIAATGLTIQIQEVAVEGIINFCRQPTFIIEAYVNYDCDPTCLNLFELIGKLLCKLSFPVAGRLTTMQMQAFEGLLNLVHTIADNVDKEGLATPFGSYPVEFSQYRPFWEEKPKGELDTWVEYLRVRKAQKKKMAIAGDHFNRDEKKGLEYLKFSNLVSDPADPKAYALFFRFTPGLDKNMIGDYLGDPDDFHIQVLKEFTSSFGFSGMILDTALRTYLATFRLPGEAQKIQRILEAFSEQFYDQQSSDIFATKDAVYILCYSLIMLNTDQHNPQVKKKMTEDEFIRNNRQINDGQDLPREYLSELFQSIANNAITVFGQSGQPAEMTPGRWIDLTNRSKTVHPLVACDFDCRLGRDMFACIAGPLVATLSAFFDQATEDEMFHECIEGLISVARISQYGLQDVLDELVASFSKFTTLLNPYASSDEIMFSFSNDLKARMATLAIFTVANSFGNSIRGGWRNIVDCLLKLKRLKLLPQSVVEVDSAFTSSSDDPRQSCNESGASFSSDDLKQGSQQNSGLISRFSHFLAVDSMEDSVSLGLSEFEQNLKIIKQCRIGSIFRNSSSLPEDALLNLGRSLIFAAGGKGQKFSTPVEEEETVGFCWDLVTVIALANIERFQTFWPAFHEFMLEIAQFPIFSPIPFAEKATEGLFRICLKLISSFRIEKQPEELIFRSINLMWNLDKEILDTYCEVITKSIRSIIVEYPGSLQSHLGWKSVLHLLSISGRLAQTYDQGVEALIVLLSDTSSISRTNYAYCIDCAFSFISLKNRPLENSLKILDLLSDSVNLLVQWYKDYSDSGCNYSVASNASNSSLDDPKGFNSPMNLFVKLGEAFRKTSLSRREEIRNHAVLSLQKSFTLAEELDFSPANCVSCFNQVIFAMVDDLHEKMIEYSRRDNAERETTSMEGTLKLALHLLTDVYLQFLKQITMSPGFRTFWLGFLRRMDTCMKANLGVLGNTNLEEVIPELLIKIISKMKEEEILVPTSDDDLWEVTYIQIQWIAPSLKEELFPESEI